MTTPEPSVAVERRHAHRSRLGDLASYWRRALRKNPNMAAGFAILLVFSLIAVIAPLISRYDPQDLNPFGKLIAPSGLHWLGTDQSGRDVYARVIYGTRVSLLVGISVAVLTSVIGVLLGLVSGYVRALDGIIMRVMDGLMAFPSILLAIALMALLGASFQNVIIALTVTEAPRMARVIRSMVLSIREWTYVDAARAVGAGPWRIMLQHILPGTFAPLMVTATYVFADAVIVEAGLSFLGAGVPPTIPSWGNIMSAGRIYIQKAIWITFFPGLALFLAVLAINLVGDGLRDTLDPKLARRQ